MKLGFEAISSYMRSHFPKQTPKGMKILVDSTIPIAAGLASSTALVVVSAIATLFANGLH